MFDIRSTKFEGAPDTEIFKLAQKKEAIFLTTDKDFFHTIPFLFEKHRGIIVIALRQPNRKSITEKLLFVLEHIDLDNLDSRVVLLRDNNYSIT